jgi:hypothetical protein
MTLAVLPTDCITVGGHWTGGKFVSRASYIGVLCDRRALQTLGRLISGSSQLATFILVCKVRFRVGSTDD